MMSVRCLLIWFKNSYDENLYALVMTVLTSLTTENRSRILRLDFLIFKENKFIHYWKDLLFIKLRLFSPVTSVKLTQTEKSFQLFEFHVRSAEYQFSSRA
jgi:glycogen debranching enzyme